MPDSGGAVKQLFLFTPALEAPDLLKETFVGRQHLLEQLLHAIEGAVSKQGLQHFVLAGPRGIGKTSLLLMINYIVRGTISVKDSWRNLNSFWEPVLLAEDEYGIVSLSELLDRIVSSLKGKLYQGMDEFPPEKTLNTDQLVEQLQDLKRSLGKRFLLLIDDFQSVLGSFTEEDQKRFRDILISHDLFMVIGACTSLFPAIVDYHLPLYNFFEIKRIESMNAEEIEELLSKRLALDNSKLPENLPENLDRLRPKLRALTLLTDGNPRLILSLYQILTAREITQIEPMMLKLLDELTPYFQDRMNELSKQQRKIMEAVILPDQGSTPTEIARRTRLGINVVTSQLRRLEKMGYLRSDREKRRRETYYNVSEQLFRFWRQMRVDAGRKRLNAILHFLEIWYSQEELTSFVEKLEKNLMKAPEDRDLIRRILDYVKEALLERQIPISLRLLSSEEVRSTQKAEIRKLIKEGIEYLNKGEFTLALERFQNALKLEPEDYLSLKYVGFIFISLGRLDEALEILLRATCHKEAEAEAWGNLGLVYSLKNKHGQAIEAYKKSLELNSDSHVVKTNLGNAYAIIGDTQSAITCFQTALKLNPQDDQALSNMGWVYAKGKQYDMAIQCFEKAAALKPKDPKIWNDFGNIFAELGQYDEAILRYEKALKLNPEDLKAHHNLGIAYIRRGSYEQAIQKLETAAAQSPNDASVMYDLGEAYARDRKYEKAVEEFRKTVRLKPDDHRGWYNLGLAYANLGKWDDAVKSYTEAISAYDRAIELADDRLKLAYMEIALTLLGIRLSNSIDIIEKNENASLEEFRRAIFFLPNTRKDMADDYLNLYFKKLFELKKVALAEKAVRLIDENQPEWADSIRFFRDALHYFRTKDMAILVRFSPERRKIIELLAQNLEKE